MRFLLDHDIPDDIARLLRHWGHEITVLREVMSITAPDEEIFSYICRQGLVVITCNRNHFLGLAGKANTHPGLIILIRRRTRHMECARLRMLLVRAGETGIAGNINFA